MSLANIKNSIQSIIVLEKATAAMRLVAISTNTLLKKEIIKYEKVFEAIYKIKADLNINLDNSDQAILYIFVGSERGLCGSYNNEIEKKIKEILSKKEHNSRKNYFFIIGKQLSNRIYKYLFEEIIIFQAFKKQLFNELTNLIYKHALSKNVNKIIFIYIKSINLFQSKILEEEFLINYFQNNNPFEDDLQKQFYDQTIFNDYYIKKLFEYTTIKIFFHALISEQSYRFVAMDKANRNALKQKEEKQIYYNKERQSKITKELQGLFSISNSD